MIHAKSKEILIGAHTSSKGGVWKALLEGEAIGASTIQLFTANQRRWHAAPLEEATVQLFAEHLANTGLTHIMSHASYLLNLGSPDTENLAKSRQAFREEIVRCRALGITYLNFHPGAALTDSKEACLARIVESLLGVKDLLPDMQLRLLVEMTAGQGSTVGKSFEEIAYIIQRTAHIVPVGVCIDTCHLFASGYDIRTFRGWDKTLAAFDRIVGLSYLFAFHLNDSKHALGSRKDRHAPLGAGAIGLPCFKYVMQADHLRALPKYLETPGGPANWKKELALLRNFL